MAHGWGRRTVERVADGPSRELVGHRGPGVALRSTRSEDVHVVGRIPMSTRTGE
jgi:hypothetical protein